MYEEVRSLPLEFDGGVLKYSFLSSRAGLSAWCVSPSNMISCVGSITDFSMWIAKPRGDRETIASRVNFIDSWDRNWGRLFACRRGITRSDCPVFLNVLLLVSRVW